MPKPHKGETKKHFLSRCMGDDEANRDFPDRDQRYAFCNSVYEKSKAHNMVDTLDLALATTSLQYEGGKGLRFEELQGREHLVAPAVLVQDQVLHNNLGATFLPSYEITEEWAEEWNGAPVIVHDHPTKRGMPVSARDPEIWNDRGVGYVFHVYVARNGATQLKAEVWLDLTRTEQVSELQTIVSRLEAGEPVELSTGFLSMTEEADGVHNGEAYEKVLHPHGADHLAIFIDKVGACSLEDGCGLGVHAMIPLEAFNVRSSARRPKYSSTTEKPWKKPTLANFEKDTKWGDLSAARKREIVATTLLGEVEDTFAASMVFPVVDASGALNRNALNAVRSIAHGGRGGADIPKAAADSAFKMAGKLLEEEFDVEVNDTAAGNVCERGIILQLIDKLGTLLAGTGGNATTQNEGTGPEFRMLLRRLKAMDMTNEEIGNAVGRTAAAIAQAERGEIVNPSEETLERLKELVKTRLSDNQAGDRSDEERRMALADALDAQYGGTGKIVWVDAVYSAKKQVVFGLIKDSLTGRTEQLYQADYTMSDDAKEISLGDPVEVIRRVVYEPSANKENKMAEDLNKKKDAGQEPAADPTKAAAATNAATQDPPKAEPQKDEPPKAEPPKADPVDNAQSQEPPKAEPAKAEPPKEGEDVKALKDEIAQLRKIVDPLVQEKERERQALVDELAANDRVPFDKAELEAKPVEELRKLRAMSRGENYAARGGPRVENVAEEEPKYMPTRPYWEKVDNKEKKEGGE